MTNAFSRSQAARFALSLMPPLIRSAVIGDFGFLMRNGLSTDATVSFTAGGPEFSQKELLAAIRMTFSAPSRSSNVSDKGGEMWALSISEPNDPLKVHFRSEEHTFAASSFWALSPLVEDRLREFDRVAAENGLRNGIAASWRRRLTREPLSDSEFEELNSELTATPLGRLGKIRSDMDNGSSRIDSLVPSELLYYERLVASCPSDATLTSFALGCGADHLRSLYDWNEAEGIRLGLLLSWHSLLVAQMRMIELGEDDILALFSWLAQEGDLISCVGSIEFGLANIDRFPWLQSKIIEIIDKLQREEPSDKGSRYHLLSCVACLVSGEMSRR